MECSAAFPQLIASPAMPQNVIPNEPWPSQGAICLPPGRQGDLVKTKEVRLGHLWLRPLAVLEPCIEQVILPDAVDAQIFARIALAHKSGVFQKPRRAGIGRDAGGLDAMQPQAAEGE